MDKEVFISIINNTLMSFGFRKQGTRQWIRKGEDISLKVYLQKSQFGVFYYLHDYYVINKMQVKSSYEKECPGDIVYSDAILLAKMCDLENDVPDSIRDTTIETLLKEAFENHYFIETEEELKEMILRRLPFVFKGIRDYLGIDSELYDSLCEQRKKAFLMRRLAQVFESSPTDDCKIYNEKKGFCLTYNPDDQEILVRLYVFVNPYTQNVDEVYQKMLDRLEYFTKMVPYENPMQEVERIEADKPSKLGYMHIELTIPDYVVDSEGIEKVKDAIFQMQEDQTPHESFVWFKADYNDHICYFEYGEWTFKRAVIMGEDGYERYEFSDEEKFDRGMWDIVTGDYDQLENSDSFELISQTAFKTIWEQTEKVHEPEPWE